MFKKEINYKLFLYFVEILVNISCYFKCYY